MTTQTTTNESFDLSRSLVAELVGTFLLVFGGTGSAVFAAAFPDTGIGFLGVALAFGLTVLAGIYAFGPISGAHFNPAVTIGLCVAGRFRWKRAPAYIAVQVAGGILASMIVLFLAASAPGGYDPTTQGLAANGYGIHSPASYGLIAALLSEIVLTFVFVSVIIGATSPNRPAGFAGIPIGLTLTLVHLVGIPITNLSVNPARSKGPAVFAGGWALDQLWLFWLAPLGGAMIAGLLGAWLYRERIAAAAPTETGKGAPVTAHPAPAGSA